MCPCSVDVAAEQARRLRNRLMCAFQRKSVRACSAEELGVILGFEGQGVEEVAIVEKIKGGNAPALKVGDVIVWIDPGYFRPIEVETLLGDPAKAKTQLGWITEISAQKISKEMKASEFGEAKQHAFL